MSTRIQSITFKRYKALEDYSVSIEHVNILTGSNNSGKSTIIGALRVLAVALRATRRIKLERISLGVTHCYGYRIKESLVPISLENVATNYVGDTPIVSFYLTNGNTLHLNFDQEAGCVLVPETRNGTVITTAEFKTQFPIDLTVIPVLGPVGHREALKTVETVTSSLSTHRASLHFRNYWHHFPEGFSEFSESIESTWPGMRIQRPELNGATELNMFVAEDRVDRELYWVGFGFQIWCQLLTHLHRSDPSTMIVIDEPEVYLHPEMQRKLLHVLKKTGADILVATHSTEIISEADTGEVLRIDKRKRHAERQGIIVSGAKGSLVNENSPIASNIAKQAKAIPLVNISADESTSVDATLGKRLALDPAEEAPNTGNVGTMKEVRETRDATKVVSGEAIKSVRAFPNPTSYRAPNIASELDALLVQAKSIGIQVEDHRTRGGGVYTALYGTPDELSSRLLRRLVELGVNIWPGKSYLK